MTRPDNYKTKQREAVLGYIMSLNGSHVTAAQIARYFENKDAYIGRTTIYRHLDRLTESGRLRRYVTDGVSGACYQYAGDEKSNDSSLHLKCESCGGLSHLSCEALNALERHVSDEHAFRINSTKTVLYGMCGACLRKE